MRYLILILLLVSCEKESVNCYECQGSVYVTETGELLNRHEIFEKCGTIDEIIDFQKESYYWHTDGTQYTYKYECTLKLD
jgi:hypothetical protein